MPRMVRLGSLAVIAAAMVLVPNWALAGWTVDGSPVCTAPGDQNSVVATSDGAGGALIAWTDRRNASPGVFVHHLLASGEADPAWPANGAQVCAACDTPRIVSDGSGGAIMTWNRGSKVQHLLATGVPDPAWPANGLSLHINPPTDATVSFMAAALVADGLGGAFIDVEYKIIYFIPMPYDYEIGNFVQHVDASGALDGLVGIGLGDHAIRTPVISSDGAGGAVAGFFTEGSYAPARGWGNHLLPSGGNDPAWPQPNYFPINQNLVADGVGGVISLFQQKALQSSNLKVYADRLLVSNGNRAPGWPPAGRLLRSELGDNLPPQVLGSAPDGTGGAFVAWHDGRNGGATEYDIYAAHVLNSGATNSPVNGALVCGAPHPQLGPVVVEDGAGGAFVAWQDVRSNDDASADIYAQHLVAAGTVDPEWPADGRPVCTALGRQEFPIFVSDGAGGAIVVWQDDRNGNLDLYAQHLTDEAVTAVQLPLGEAGLALSLRGVTPNPSRGGFAVAFSLPSSELARVQLVDVEGRLIESRSLTEPGDHVVRLAEATAAPPGVYFVRVTQAGRSISRRVCRIR